MPKGKHSTNDNSDKKISKCFIFLPFLAIVILCFTGAYFLIHKNNSALETENKPIEYEDSKIEISRYVKGLETLQILGVDIKSAETSSKISISLKNTSAVNIEPCNLIFYMLNENKEKIFGTNLNVRLISPNEEITLKVFCTDDLSTATDYEIEFNTYKK